MRTKGGNSGTPHASYPHGQISRTTTSMRFSTELLRCCDLVFRSCQDNPSFTAHRPAWTEVVRMEISASHFVWLLTCSRLYP